MCISGYLTYSLALTFVFLLQVSLGEREQTNLHGQDADLSTAATAGTTHTHQTVAMSQLYLLWVYVCVQTVRCCVFSSVPIGIICNGSDRKSLCAWKEKNVLLSLWERAGEIINAFSVHPQTMFRPVSMLAYSM